MPSESFDDHLELVTDSLGCFGINFGAVVGSLPVHDEDRSPSLTVGGIVGVGEEGVSSGSIHLTEPDQVIYGLAEDLTGGVGHDADRIFALASDVT
jgi:hypothetical protein